MRLLAIAVICIGFQISGCAMFAVGDKSDITPIPEAAPAPLTLIASDFVHAISQLDSVPFSTTTVDLQQSDREDAFTRAVQQELQGAGYGTRWVGSQGTGLLFQYRQVSDKAAASASRDIYELAVGDIEMRRSYVTDKQQRVRPVSPLYVRGTDASGIVLNDGKFALADVGRSVQSDAKNAIADAPNLAVRVNTGSSPALTQAQDKPSSALGLQNSSTLQVPTDANPLNPTIAKAAAGDTLSLPLVSMPSAQNVFDLGGSNFDTMLGGHTVVAEQILTFANDSMRLGELNKQLVEKLVARFDPRTDVFSVIGCSMGPTQVRGGNAALALGRAGRVVEALRFAGIDDDRILDEGCWAGDGSLDSLPARGVVLTLNRQA